MEVSRDTKGRTQRVSLTDDRRVAGLLRELGLLREEYIVLREGRVLTELDILRDGDSVRLIRAFSGG